MSQRDGIKIKPRRAQNVHSVYTVWQEAEALRHEGRSHGHKTLRCPSSCKHQPIDKSTPQRAHLEHDLAYNFDNTLMGGQRRDQVYDEATHALPKSQPGPEDADSANDTIIQPLDPGLVGVQLVRPRCESACPS